MTNDPSGDAPTDARSDVRSSLTLRYRYRFANAALTPVAYGGNPQDRTGFTNDQ
ncbi:hypothetical protein [Nostoc sp. ChiVER01]|uniref:hypothetical protein n=1 Tax=Nostoc sp. ChiVER01 TaxID=3075382 RepID=UPI002AD59959|nr:hypothetical protein [Nostoc sp. ChiVER01]MDZ8222199.1 hypothetical protein [Nostoc sp. ChiVER01]